MMQQTPEPEPVYAVEFEDSDQVASRCSCCGQQSVTVWGYIYRDDDAFGVYYLGGAKGHDLFALLSWDGWGEGQDPTKRVFVALRLTVAGERLKSDLISPHNMPEIAGMNVGVLGRALEPPAGTERSAEWFGAYASAVGQDPRIGEMLRGDGFPLDSSM